MAIQKVSVHQNTITAKLTDEERDILEAFAAEQGIDDLSDAIPALLHELVRLHDHLWDAQLADLPPALVEMGEAALQAYEAGETETFDPDTPGNRIAPANSATSTTPSLMRCSARLQLVRSPGHHPRSQRVSGRRMVGVTAESGGASARKWCRDCERIVRE